MSRQRWGDNSRVSDQASGRHLILLAAKHCFAEASIESTSIDQVAQQAGVSRRTVYRYFANKPALVLAVVEDQAEVFFTDMHASVGKLGDLDFPARLKHCVLYSIDHGPQVNDFQLVLGKKNAASTVAFYLSSERLKQHWHELLERPFLNAQQAGQLDAGLNFEDLVIWMGRITLSFIQFPEDIVVVERLLDQYLLRGLTV